MKSIRSLAFRFGLSTLAVAATSLVGGAARADSTPSPSGKCETTLQCSSGNASLRAQGRGPFVTTVSTGWLPACTTPDPKGHCIGDQDLQFRADIALNAPEDPAQMLYDVDMRKGAIVDVTWPDTDSLTLKLAGGAQTDGNFVIQHTLTPNVGVYVGKVGPFSLDKEWNWDASVLVQGAPGAHWNYLGTGTSQFLPWALGGTSVDVKGPDLANSQLFSVPLQSLPGLSGILEGTLGMSATTSPTFTYKTTKVNFTGVGTTITQATPSAKIKVQNADAIDLFASVEGELTFTGTMEVLPVLTITKIYSLAINIQIPISIGAKTDYDSGKTPYVVTFPGTKIHVPLPNLSVPNDLIDFGTIKTGSQAEKKITVNNTGELGAILSIESSDPAFVVPSPQAQMTQKSTSDLVVRYQPTKDGPATATITVKSNDPDAPVQTFDVKGNAEPTAAAPPPGNTGTTEPPVPAAQPASNSGCGCRVTSPTMSGEAGTALLGLAALAIVRRRRTSKK